MYCELKRILDVLFAIFLLVTLWPFFLLLALCVAFFIGTPVIFKQKRTGYQKKDFWIYKFRTMKNALDEEGRKLKDHERLNIIGKYIRSLSLDELPQLYNILKGDMSFVGPRPQMAEYTCYCNSHQAQRFQVRPGITGWAQINGRNKTTWDERYNHDVEYVKNMSLMFDIQIILRTIPMVLKRSGIFNSEDECMPHPNGYTPHHD